MDEYRINVYKIWWEDEPDKFYVGSTKKRLLSERMNQHRASCRAGGEQTIYQVMREKGINTFRSVLLGWAMVSSFDEQRMVEQDYISRLNPTLNSRKAFVSDEERKEQLKEWRAHNYEQNKEDIKKKSRDYRAGHKEQVSEYNQKYDKEHKGERAESWQQYYNENKERLKAKTVEYHKQHKAERNQKAREQRQKCKDIKVCVCGGSYDHSLTAKKKRHDATKKHTDFVNAIMTN